MDFIEFNKDATKLLRDVQCLQIKMRVLTKKNRKRTVCDEILQKSCGSYKCQ